MLLALYNIRMKDISVIVVSYNTKDMTQSALDSIQLSLSHSPTLTYEIIIIDNNSQDGSAEMLASYKAHSINGSIITILNNDNRGFGAAKDVYKRQGINCKGY